MRHIRFIILALTMLAAGSATVYAAEAPKAGIEVNDASAPGIRPVSGGVEITVNSDENAQVLVYAITGQLVKSLRVHPGTTRVDLASGCYIVRVDGLSKRVIVK